MAVDLGRDSRVAMAKDALNGGGVRASHHQERCGRVAKIVKADLPHLGARPELHLALRAASQTRVSCLFRVTASLATTTMHVAGNDSGATKG